MKKLIALAGAILCGIQLCACGLGRMVSSMSSYKYDSEQSYTAGGGELSQRVDELDIEWLSGKVELRLHQQDTVAFSETANQELDGDKAMRYWLEGSTLHIRFSKAGEWNFNKLNKTLTVYLPEKIGLNALDVETVSADVEAEGIAASYASVNTVSGHVSMRDCLVYEAADINTTSGTIDGVFIGGMEELDINTISGSIDVSAEELDSFDVNSTSGSVTLRFKTAPENGEISTISGKVELYLPEDADFILDMDSLSGKFSSELPVYLKDGVYICGDGNSEYSVDTSSGNVEVKKS